MVRKQSPGLISGERHAAAMLFSLAIVPRAAPSSSAESGRLVVSPLPPPPSKPAPPLRFDEAPSCFSRWRPGKAAKEETPPRHRPTTTRGAEQGQHDSDEGARCERRRRRRGGCTCRALRASRTQPGDAAVSGMIPATQQLAFPPSAAPHHPTSVPAAEAHPSVGK